MFIANTVLVANKIGSIEGNHKFIKKCRKLLKTGKLFKSWKSAKSKKKLSKSENLSNFDVKKNGPSFITLNTRIAFNYSWLTFTKAPILQYFDLEYYIWIEINRSSYVIDGILSYLASETRPDEIITKTNLGQWYLVAFFL